MRIATGNVRTLHTAGRMNELMKEVDKYKIDICALQGIRWPGKGTLIKTNYMILYSGHESYKHEFETGFCISRYIMHNSLDPEHINERIFKIKVKLKYCNLTLTSTHVPTEGKGDVTKEIFYTSLKKVSDAVHIFDKCHQIMAPAEIGYHGKEHTVQDVKKYLHHWSKKQIRWD